VAGNYSWPILLLVGLLVAVAAWSLLYGLIWYFRGGDARVRARIKQFVTEENTGAITEAEERKQVRANLFDQMDRRLSERSFLSLSFKKLNEDIGKADLHSTVTEFVLIQVSVSAGFALILFLLAPNPAIGYILAVIGFIAGIMLGRSYLRYLGKRRITRFEEQLPDTLSILASSVRGGFSLFQALQLIAKEASEPSRSEFLRVMQQISLELPLELAALLQGVNAALYYFFFRAVRPPGEISADTGERL